MIWSSWSEFLAMGGYGAYVWGSFGMTAVLILGELLSLGARRRALRHAPAHDVQADFSEATHEA